MKIAECLPQAHQRGHPGYAKHEHRQNEMVDTVSDASPLIETLVIDRKRAADREPSGAQRQQQLEPPLPRAPRVSDAVEALPPRAATPMPPPAVEVSGAAQRSQSATTGGAKNRAAYDTVFPLHAASLSNEWIERFWIANTGRRWTR